MHLMSWRDWARLDAIARLEPELDAVLEVFEDVITNPDSDRPDPAGLLYGVPILAITSMPASSKTMTSSHRFARSEPGTLVCGNSSTAQTFGERRRIASVSISSNVTPLMVIAICVPPCKVRLLAALTCTVIRASCIVYRSMFQ